MCTVHTCVESDLSDGGKKRVADGDERTAELDVHHLVFVFAFVLGL